MTYVIGSVIALLIGLCIYIKHRSKPSIKVGLSDIEKLELLKNPDPITITDVTSIVKSDLEKTSDEDLAEKINALP